MNKTTRRKRNNAQEIKITPGSYMAKITAVEEPEGFRPGSAIDIVYEVKFGSNIVKHRERFSLNGRSARTDDLDKLLDSLGTDTYEELVGATVLLTFYYELKAGRKYCNVTERKLVDGGDADGTDCA